MRIRRIIEALMSGAIGQETATEQRYHQARMPVTAALLHSLFLMPGSTRIVNAVWDPTRNTLELILEDPDLPWWSEGDKLPVALPAYSTYDGIMIQADWDHAGPVGDVFPEDDE